VTWGDERLPDVFWERTLPEPMSGCWLWLGAESAGCAQAWINGRSMTGHRVAYEALRCPIPRGEYVKHTCGVRLCVNPDHMVTGVSKRRLSVVESDLTGLEIDRLTVVRQHSEWRPRGHTVWECVCRCGGTRLARTDVLRARRVRSCGCLRSEILKRRAANLRAAGGTEGFLGICETIVDVCTRFAAPASAVFAAVRGVWGRVDDRYLYRALRSVLKAGKIGRIGKHGSPDGGYVRVVPWASNLAACIAEAAATYAVLERGVRRAA
jgi:hypothetical protein